MTLWAGSRQEIGASDRRYRFSSAPRIARSTLQKREVMTQARLTKSRGASTMQAVQISEYGAPEVLTFTEVPDPVVKAGEVLVDVAAAGVNYYDTYQREGTYQVPLPYVPRLEGAGTVRAIGEGGEGIPPGTRVAWPHTLGSCAPLGAVPPR